MLNNQQIQTILIYRVGSLGDTLVALPAFHLLRTEFRHCNIILLTNSPIDGGIKAAASYQILIGSGLINNFIEYPVGQLSILSILNIVKNVRQTKPYKVIYLMPQRSLLRRIRDGFFFLACGIWNVSGLFPHRGCYTNQKINDENYYESEASRILRTIGYSPKQLTQANFSLNLQQDEYKTAQNILKNIPPPYIALSLGAKVPAKDWGTDRWTELVKLLNQQLYKRYTLVFLGTLDEYDRCDSIAANLSGEVLNLCGALSPRQSAAVLAQACLFIGHDSGPMHLASSVGIPCISIFAARDKPGVWFPFGNEHNVFYNNVPCSNCKLSVCIDKEMICIRSIKATDVADRVQLLLNQ